MNDRFRFRVWDKENHILHILQDGKKYDCDSVEIAFDGSLIGTSFNDEIERKEHSISYLGGQNCVLEQCTGLKDKNGKLIYEGDILRRKNSGGRMVEWDESELAFFFTTLDKETSTPLACYDMQELELEIVGNIHENPELLEVEE